MLIILLLILTVICCIAIVSFNVSYDLWYKVTTDFINNLSSNKGTACDKIKRINRNQCIISAIIFIISFSFLIYFIYINL